jgi:hypothetical protein
VVFLGGFRLVGKQFLKSYPYEGAFFGRKAARFRRRLDLPIILLGGISNLATAGAPWPTVLVRGHGRALLRPDLINQWQAGTRQASGCIHCNRCMPTSTRARAARWWTAAPATGLRQRRLTDVGPGWPMPDAVGCCPTPQTSEPTSLPRCPTLLGYIPTDRHSIRRTGA